MKEKNTEKQDLINLINLDLEKMDLETLRKISVETYSNAKW